MLRAGEMNNYSKFYIDGQWVEPLQQTSFDVINPATEEVTAQISLGGVADVDRAAKAARKAFATFSTWSVEQRIKLLERVIDEYERRFDEVAWAITQPAFKNSPKDFVTRF